MGLGKWIALGAGFAAAPFTGGASIPIGTAAFGAMNANEAAKKASEQQNAAADEAQAVNQAAYQPYMNLGGQAANSLGGLMGFSPMAAAAAPGGANSLGAMNPRSRPPDAPIIGHAKPRPDPATADVARTLGDLRPAMAKAQTQSGYVRMRDDEGQEMDVPMDIASQLERAGARRV